MGFRNKHLSFSRLARFEQCPAAFKYQYIDGVQTELTAVPLLFGKVVHATLERVFQDVIAEEATGPIDEARAKQIFADAWAESGLVGAEVYREGLEIVRNFVRSEGVVDHRDVLAVEKDFRLPLGRFSVIGCIDRVNRVDDETIEVVDYKTNRAIFTREEVDDSLQLSLYEVAARRIWPWAKKVRLSFAMLRHGLRMTTSRTPEQLEAALAYAETLGKMTEESKVFPARLSTNCAYCDHRERCPAYENALKGKRTTLSADPRDLTAVAKEREEVAKLSKILYARKGELENVLRAHLKEHDDLVLAGVRYSLAPTQSVRYPLGPTLKVLEAQTGLPREQLLERVATIDKDALDALIRQSTRSLDRSRVHLVRAELDAVAERSVSARFSAREVRS